MTNYFQFLQNENTGACAACSENCESCTDWTECSQCKKGYAVSIVTRKCVKKCEFGFYKPLTGIHLTLFYLSTFLSLTSSFRIRHIPSIHLQKRYYINTHILVWNRQWIKYLKFCYCSNRHEWCYLRHNCLHCRLLVFERERFFMHIVVCTQKHH